MYIKFDTQEDFELWHNQILLDMELPTQRTKVYTTISPVFSGDGYIAQYDMDYNPTEEDETFSYEEAVASGFLEF